MSQSKSPAGKKATRPKAKTKAPAKRKTVAAVETLETVRIIPAQTAAVQPQVGLTPEEQALSSDANALARRIEQGLANAERSVVLDPAAVQALLAAVSRVYSRHVEQGEPYDAFSNRNPVTPTDVMVTASGLLKAANLAVFELGMWQSWTGR